MVIPVVQKCLIKNCAMLYIKRKAKVDICMVVKGDKGKESEHIFLQVAAYGSQHFLDPFRYDLGFHTATNYENIQAMFVSAYFIPSKCISLHRKKF